MLTASPLLSGLHEIAAKAGVFGLALLDLLKLPTTAAQPDSQQDVNSPDNGVYYLGGDVVHIDWETVVKARAHKSSKKQR